MNLKSKIINRDNIGWFYVLPALIYMGYFVVYPIVSNFILSMQEVTVMTIARPERPFVGIKNYTLLFADPVLKRAIFNTLLFTVCCLVFQFIIGFALALLFNRNTSLSKSIRGIMMIPWMIPITITALIFRFMFASNVGIINHALLAAGLISSPINWLLTPNTAMFALIVSNIWIGIPFNMILISTGLTTIPKELYESASIDGASRVKSLFSITLPMLRATIESVLILGFIYTFKVFDIVYVMTGGGPVNTTQVLSTFSYRLSFELFNYSQGAAAANILFVILFIAGLLYLKLTYSDRET